MLLLYLPIDELSHKLKLLKEVSLELAESSTDEKVVMWVLDSFSTLVSNALDDKRTENQSRSAYSGVITMLFDLNTSMHPIAVCSSVTSAGDMSESTSTHFSEEERCLYENILIFLSVLSQSAYLDSNNRLVSSDSGQ